MELVWGLEIISSYLRVGFIVSRLSSSNATLFFLQSRRFKGTPELFLLFRRVSWGKDWAINMLGICFIVFIIAKPGVKVSFERAQRMGEGLFPLPPWLEPCRES